MKSQLSLRLVAVALLATCPFDLSAQQVPALISTPTTITNALPASKRVSVVESKLKQLRPGETVELRAARHDQEFKDAEARAAALVKDFPLLTAPGWEQKQATFRAALARLKRDPQYQPKPPAPPKALPGQRPARRTAAQFRAERHAEDMALMRKQADKVLETHADLRDFVEQLFQWHQRMFELMGKYHDNPKVRELAVSRLAQPAPVK